MATRAQAMKVLKECGWEMAFEPTKDVWGVWDTTIDPVGKMSIGGDCRGSVCTSTDTGGKASLWDAIIKEATELKSDLTPCTDPECDMHSDAAMAEAAEFRESLTAQEDA